MKSILAIFIYVIFKDLPLDAILGIVAGLSFGLLCVMVFVGPTPAPRHAPAKAIVRKPSQRKPRRIIEQSTPKAQYGLSIFNYTPTEWGIA